jgi:uncharacterized protein YabE (DUF348 family)
MPETRKRRWVNWGLVVAVSMLALLFCLVAWGGYAWAKKDVVLKDGDQAQTLFTFKRTVGEMLAAEGIEVGPRDAVEPALDTVLKDGLEVRIARAVPVTVRVDGDERRELTRAATVGDLLHELNITPRPNDLVRPDPATPVEKGLLVALVRVSEEMVEEEVELAYSVSRRPAYNLEKGKTSVVAKGAPGLERRSFKVVYHDGLEVVRELVSTTTVRKPKDEVVLVGMVQTVSRGGQDMHFSRVLEARATAYTYTGNNTATGKPPGPGTIAVDPTVIPLGSKLYIDGYGYGNAMDVGRSIKGNRVDVFFPTRTEALRWGSRNVNVYVMSE